MHTAEKDLPNLPEDSASLKAMLCSLFAERDREKQRADDLHIQNLRLQLELARYKKWYYGPRADRLNSTSELAQVLLDFGQELEQRPIHPEDAPAASEPEYELRRVKRRKGRRSQSFGIDAHAVMKIFCEDKQLNISTAYLMPGFAFGGSCLPKDLRALAYKAKTNDLQLPIMSAILPSNELQVSKGLRLITEKGHRRIGVLGFSFKSGTDDLRESPMIEVIEHLIGKGYDLRIFDRNVNLASLVGANRDFILNRIPHISRLMVHGIDAVLDHAETVVIGNKDPEFEGVLGRLREGQNLVDFVRITSRRSENGKYDGICW